LPPINELERQLNAGLASDLPKALRNGRHPAAFDVTLTPASGWHLFRASCIASRGLFGCLPTGGNQQPGAIGRDRPL
jgi:hypothetical protein